MQHLKIALIQADLIWQQAVKNRTKFQKVIAQLPADTDLIVLPEMFSTGFGMQPQKIAETMQGETVKWLQKTAIEKQAAITGSVVIVENNNYYNRLLFVYPSGEIQFYNKRHLFTLAGEHKAYTAGEERLVVSYKDWNICPLVCYDLRFPVFSRNTNNYDLLLYVANWPKPRITAWDTLLKARAIENICYTVGVNRVGTDANNLTYNGHSAVYDCLGEKIASSKEGVEEVVCITLSKNHVATTRKTLNFLNDKDAFTLQ